MLKRYIPFLFVLLWSTGFIGAKFGLPYASTGDFLSIRAVANVCVLLVILMFVTAPKLTHSQIFHASVTGLLIHGAYLGGVFGAIEYGVPAGLTAIIVGLQPLLTALLAVLVLTARVSNSQWFALALGFFGLMCVIGSSVLVSDINTHATWYAFLALFGITLGTLYQKRFCQGQPLLPAVFWQYVASLLVFLPIAYLEPSQTIDWNINFVLSLAWLVLALSVVAIMLLLYMVEQGEASKVTAYLYLVPPATALEAWLLFDEQLSSISIIGMFLCAFSVYWVMNVESKNET